jgi:hypothetical protein
MRSKLKQIILATATLAVVSGVGAAERIDVARVIACADERDDARRLACFDSATASVKTPVAEKSPPAAPTAAAKPAVSAPAVPPAVVAPADEFGITGSAVARQRRNEEEQAQAKVEARSISATVTEVTARPYGELVVTLDNAQVWMQKDPARFPIKPGDQVTINAGTLGSFHMVNGNRSTRVTRVK